MGNKQHTTSPQLGVNGIEVSKSEEIGTPLMKNNERRRENNKSGDKTIVIIDSGSDGDDFDTRHKKKKSTSKKKSSKPGKRKLENKDKSRGDIRSLLSPSLASPSQNLASQSSADPMVLSDSESDLTVTNTLRKPESENAISRPVFTGMADTNKEVTDIDSIEGTNSANSDCDLNPVVPNRKRSANISDENNKPVCDSVPQEPGPSLETKTSCERSCGQWSCSLCTFLNHKDLVVCEMCETPKKMNKTKAVIKQAADRENIKEKLQGETGKMDAAATEVSIDDKKKVAVIKHKPEVVVEFSMNGLKQNRNNVEMHSESAKHINTPAIKKKVKRYSNSLHDLSSSDDEPLENQIENYNSDSEEKAASIDLLSKKSVDFTPKQNHGRQSPGSVSDTPKSEMKKSHVQNNCLDRKNDVSKKLSEANCDQDVGTLNKVKAGKLGDSDCSSPKPGTSSEVHTPKKYTFKPFNTPKKYRFKSVDRSLGNSPLTPPPVLTGCYSRDIHGSMVKETNYRQSPQSHNGIGKGDLVTKSDTKERDNNKPLIDDFSAKTGKKPKISVGINNKVKEVSDEVTVNNVNKVKGDKGEVRDIAEFSSPEMEELYAGVYVEQMEQSNGAGKTNVRRQLDTGEN